MRASDLVKHKSVIRKLMITEGNYSRVMKAFEMWSKRNIKHFGAELSALMKSIVDEHMADVRQARAAQSGAKVRVRGKNSIFVTHVWGKHYPLYFSSKRFMNQRSALCASCRQTGPTIRSDSTRSA